MTVLANGTVALADAESSDLHGQPATLLHRSVHEMAGPRLRNWQAFDDSGLGFGSYVVDFDAADQFGSPSKIRDLDCGK